MYIHIYIHKPLAAVGGDAVEPGLRQGRELAQEGLSDVARMYTI